MSSTTLVNARFQEIPLQDIKSFTGKVTVPGIGPKNAEKLVECNNCTPSALVGHPLCPCRVFCHARGLAAGLPRQDHV